MEELLNQVLAAAKGMWKYRWPGVAAAWAVGIAASVAVMRTPEWYEASARIFVDTQSILKPLMSGIAVQPNVDQQVTMLSRTLISRPNVEKLVRMADLDLKDSSPRRQEERIEELMKDLKIQSVGRDNLYTLSYRDTNPEQAKRVVQSLVSIFVESSLGASRKDTDSAKVFINEQIKAYQTKLEEAEARLKEFRIRNAELQASDGRDAATRLADLAAQLDMARVQLREAEQGREAAKAALDNERNPGAVPQLPNLLEQATLNVSTPEIDGRIEAQKRNLDSLLQRFTDQHPDVLATRRLLRDLDEQKKTAVAEARRAAAIASAADGGRAGTNSLAYQEMSRMLAAADIQVATLRARVSEFSARVEQARSKLKDAPRIEAEAAQLNRDYAIHKKAYEDLVARRESAALSGNLENVSGLADFRLIDPPRVSPKPVAPNRLMLLGLALVAALGAGAGVAFAASQLRPVFHRSAELYERFGLPLLGVVSLVQTDAERRRERWDLLRFSAASVGLVASFGIGIGALAVLRGL
jgi:polysaccharide chain length determinant protein (PEP-CTERM system associated)